MQSMHDSNTSAASTSMESNGKDLFAPRVHPINRIYCSVEENIPCYDILEWFPILYCQSVFKHLSAKDLLEASVVNTEWYKFVAERPQIKKLKLVTITEYESEWTEEATDILEMSKRQYENFEMDGISECYLKFLEGRAGSWKSVIIEASYDEDFDKWSNMFKIIEPTVEELDIHTRRVNPTKVTSKLKFPHLTSLTCKAFESNAYENFLHCQNLVKFHWEANDPNTVQEREFRSNFTPDVLTILRNNPCLKDITANDDVMAAGNSFRFKLQKLRVTGREGRGVPVNLFSFLKAHAQTLESLEILVELNRACLELILTGFPNLRKLSMDYFYNGRAVLRNRPLPMNTTITTFELTDALYGNRKCYGVLIKALQNLKHFKSDLIDCLLLVNVAQNAPTMEIIETGWFDLAYLPEEEIFPNIKEFKAETFNEFMREPTAENKFAALVAKEMRNHPEIEFYEGDSSDSNTRNADTDSEEDLDSEDGSDPGLVAAYVGHAPSNSGDSSDNFAVTHSDSDASF